MVGLTSNFLKCHPYGIGFISPERTIYRKGLDKILPVLTHNEINRMGQSLAQNYVHIVFSTKHREELIFPPYEQELHAYIGGICKELECPVLIVGGYTNHIHILCMLSKKNTTNDIGSKS